MNLNAGISESVSGGIGFQKGNLRFRIQSAEHIRSRLSATTQIRKSRCRQRHIKIEPLLAAAVPSDRELEIKHGKVDETLQTSARRGALSTQSH